MIVELMDMDVPYTVSTDVNDYGLDFVRISPNDAKVEKTICLSEHRLDELILTLQFVKMVLKSYKKII